MGTNVGRRCLLATAGMAAMLAAVPSPAWAGGHGGGRGGHGQGGAPGHGHWKHRHARVDRDVLREFDALLARIRHVPRRELGFWLKHSLHDKVSTARWAYKTVKDPNASLFDKGMAVAHALADAARVVFPLPGIIANIALVGVSLGVKWWQHRRQEKEQAAKQETGPPETGTLANA